MIRSLSPDRLRVCAAVQWICYAGAGFCLAAASLNAAVIVDASANAAAIQGAQIIGTNAHVRNGVLVQGDNYTGNLGQVITVGPLGSGVTSASVNILQNGFSGQTTVSAGASATSNLRTGSLGAGVAGNNVSISATPAGIGEARFSDQLTFVNTTAGPLFLSINWQITGTVVNQTGVGTAYVTSVLQFGANGLSPNLLGFQGAPAGLEGLNYVYSNGGPAISGIWGDYLNPNPVWTVTGSGLNRTMQSALIFSPGSTIVDISALLNVNCNGGSLCDFSHTAGFTFGNLPAGLTWTSESGVFLAGEPSQGVPEPATWSLIMAGVAALGLRRRFRS